MWGCFSLYHDQVQAKTCARLKRSKVVFALYFWSIFRIAFAWHTLSNCSTTIRPEQSRRFGEGLCWRICFRSAGEVAELCETLEKRLQQKTYISLLTMPAETPAICLACRMDSAPCAPKGPSVVSSEGHFGLLSYAFLRDGRPVLLPMKTTQQPMLLFGKNKCVDIKILFSNTNGFVPIIRSGWASLLMY